jgi:DNA repair photolyase
MIVREIQAKTILSKSKVHDYVVNPYVGCEHACVYCYAKFMKRFTGHLEPWGDFVDARVNAPALLSGEVGKKPVGRVWVSGVCDAYQPLERKYGLTRQCLEILAAHRWPATIQTKSPLVLRDLDIIRNAPGFEAGMSVTTGDEEIRQWFEPGAPPIPDRVRALAELHEAGIRTFAMIAPLLPRPEGLASLLIGKVDYVLIDRLNYHNSDWLFRKHHLESARGDPFFRSNSAEIAATFQDAGVECRVLF